MSIFVAWLVSTIVTVSVTIARSLTEIESLNWFLIPLWIVNPILFLSMLYSLTSRVCKLYGYERDMTNFVITLIATIVTLILVFSTIVAKISIPIFIPLFSCLITFVLFCHFLYSLTTTVKFLEDLNGDKKREY